VNKGVKAGRCSSHGCLCLNLEKAEAFLTRPEVERSTYPIQNVQKDEARKSDWLKRLGSSTGDPTLVFVEPIVSGEK